MLPAKSTCQPELKHTAEHSQPNSYVQQQIQNLKANLTKQVTDHQIHSAHHTTQVNYACPNYNQALASWPLEKVLEKIEEASNNQAKFKRK